MQPVRYRPEVDGLRAVAVLAVVLHHLWPVQVPGGFVGVDVFFVISGFLITGIVVREVGEGRFSLARFYERRVRRLFPALFVVLAATLAASWLLLPPSDADNAFRAAQATLVFGANVLFWKTLAAGYFATDAKLNPLLHTWSLGVEEQFYLLYPLLLLVVVRYARRSALPWIAALAVASFAAAQWLLSAHPVAVFFLAPFRAWELLAGALLALGVVPPIGHVVIRESVAAAGLGAIVASAFLYRAGIGFGGVAALLPVVGACAVIHAGDGRSRVLARLLCPPPVLYLGLISYSLYLWHWPLIVFARFATQMRDDTGLALPLLGASIVLAAASHRFIEAPFRRAAGVSRPVLLRGAVVTAAVLAASSAWALASEGGRARFDAAARHFDAARREDISFIACDRAIGGCRIGNRSAPVTMLVWGDSHALAWAPAFDRELSTRGRGALLMANAACPPIARAESTRIAGCVPLNALALAYLRAHPELVEVVLVANWNSYLGPHSVLANPASAASDLRETISAMALRGRRIVVLAPVPVYPESVPLVLALGRGRGGNLGKTRAIHAGEQAAFRAIAPSLRAAGADIVDPADWICRPVCAVATLGTTSLYRDGNHLSRAGAITYSPPLGAALLDRAPRASFATSMGALQ